MASVLHFQVDQSLVIFEGNSRSQILSGDLQRTKNVPSIFSDESHVRGPLDVLVESKSQYVLKPSGFSETAIGEHLATER